MRSPSSDGRQTIQVRSSGDGMPSGECRRRHEPVLPEARTDLRRLLDRPGRGADDVMHDQVGVNLARTPDLQAPRHAAAGELPAGVVDWFSGSAQQKLARLKVDMLPAALSSGRTFSSRHCHDRDPRRHVGLRTARRAESAPPARRIRTVPGFSRVVSEATRDTAASMLHRDQSFPARITVGHILRSDRCSRIGRYRTGRCRAGRCRAGRCRQISKPRASSGFKMRDNVCRVRIWLAFEALSQLGEPKSYGGRPTADLHTILTKLVSGRRERAVPEHAST